MMNPKVFIAAKNGDKSLYSLERKLLRGKTFEDNTVLHIAAREGHVDMVKWILLNVKGCCMPVARNVDLNTPLHEAAKRGNAEIITTLVRYNKCAAAKRNQFGESALIIASEHGHLEAAKVLVESTPVYIILWPRNDRQTCLHVAAYGGHLEIVKSILGRKSFCDILQLIMIIHDVHGATPLHSAAQKGNLQIVNEILNKQLNAKFYIQWFVKSLMQKKDKLGRCAIHLAAMKGNQEMIDEFLLIMPDCLEIHSADLKTALHFAVEHNKFDMVKKLLPQDKREEMKELLRYDRDMFGNTLLHCAIIKGVDPELVEYLLPCVDLHAINDEGRSAFDIAAAAAASAAAAKSENEHKLTKVKDILQQDGASESYIEDSPLNPVNYKQDSNVPEKVIDVDTLVASLIATITFAAIFTVPGGIDDKDSGGIAPAPSGIAPAPSGVARMALQTLFHVFLFSDSLAMFASLTVVIAWLFRERLQTKLMSERSLLPKLSVLSLGISIVSTGLAFLSATILVTVPRDSSNMKNSGEYESLLWGEIFTAFSAPALSLVLLSILWIIEFNFNATLEIRARLKMQVKEALLYIIPPLAVVLGIIIAFGYQYYVSE